MIILSPRGFPSLGLPPLPLRLKRVNRLFDGLVALCLISRFNKRMWMGITGRSRGPSRTIC